MNSPAGPGDVLSLIRRGSMTRAAIGEALGLSRVTVAQRVDLLTKAGWVREAGTGRSTGGRRPIELMFDDRNSYLLTATVETMHTRLAAVDLSGGVIAEHEIEADIKDGPESVLDRIESQFADLREKVGHEAELAGVGIAIPAPVDPTHRSPQRTTHDAGLGCLPHHRTPDRLLTGARCRRERRQRDGPRRTGDHRPGQRLPLFGQGVHRHRLRHRHRRHHLPGQRRRGR